MPDMTKEAIQELKKVDHFVTMDQDDLEHSEAALVPEGHEIKDLERYHMRPRRIRQTIDLQSMDSFLDYVKHHKTDDSVIFFDENNYRAQFISDYHSFAMDRPAWCDHTATYAAKLDERWEAWVGKDNSAMTQLELADFIESRVKDFKEPSGTEMLTIATEFQAKKDVHYSNGINLNNGDIQFSYTSKDAKGTMEVPSRFTLAIPIFRNSDNYAVEARFRYRLKEDYVQFRFELMYLDEIRRDAIEGMLEKLKESGLQVYLGVKR